MRTMASLRHNIHIFCGAFQLPESPFPSISIASGHTQMSKASTNKTKLKSEKHGYTTLSTDHHRNQIHNIPVNRKEVNKPVNPCARSPNVSMSKYITVMHATYLHVAYVSIDLAPRLKLILR